MPMVLSCRENDIIDLLKRIIASDCNSGRREIMMLFMIPWYEERGHLI
jgi:hypothetical protein